MSKKRVCYVVCYRDPNYTRTNSLINALRLIDGIELLVIKNKHRGWFRYFEIPPRLLMTRLKYHPDIFIVGFRAHEIFWAFYPSMVGKKIIFDEFIDLHDYLVNEHKKLKADSPIIKFLDWYMRLVMEGCSYVLTDTEAHAKLAEKNYGMAKAKVKPIPIGADEKLFYPRQPKLSKTKFKILFYGSMLPLHGLEYILGALLELKKKDKITGIELTLAGGREDQALADRIYQFKKVHNLEYNLIHIPWVELSDLPAFISTFHLNLGGPFGNTGQARRVITGKTYQLLCMGAPVVVGKIEGMYGFKDKDNCLAVEQGSARAISNAIEWAAEHKSELPKIGRAGNRLFKVSFSSAAISEKLKVIISNE